MTIENKLKRRFTGIVGFSLLIPALFAESALKKPNIIVFIADDLGWEDLEPYGNNQIITPNISSLARQGCRFDKVFLTASSSSPSRASILTSLYPSETGAAELHQSLPSSSVLATTPLRDVGYFAESVGKWHLGEVKSQWDKVSNALDHQMGDAWVNAIRNMPRDKPFFLWAAAYDPHRGYNDITPKVHDPEALTLPSYLPDIPIVSSDYADYYNEITRFDEHIGMAVEELKRLNLFDNTIIVIMSDNGSPMPTAKTRTNLQGMKTPLIIVNADRVKQNSTNDALLSSIDIMPTLLEWAGTKFPAKVSGKSFANICVKNKQTFRKYAFAEHNWHDFKAYERAIYSDYLILNMNYLPHLPATPPNDVVKSKAYQEFRKMYEKGLLDSTFNETFYHPRSEYELWNYVKDLHCAENVIGSKAYRREVIKMKRVLKNHSKQTGDVFPGEMNLTKDKFCRRTGSLL